MPKFQAYGKVVGSKFIGEFTAKNKKEAQKMAEAQAYVSLCHQCASEVEDPEITEIIIEEG